MQKPSLSAETTIVQQLRRSVRGRIIAPGDPDYDRARAVFYTGLTRLPSAIARPEDSRDAARIVSFARESGLRLAVRSGGHSLAGHSGVDQGIVLDLSAMRGLAIDAGRRTAWAETGLTAGEYTSAAGAHGLATGFGDTPSVGIGGITLGGGVGFLHRQLGLTIDSLLAADVVTSDGQLLRTDTETHPDLFWAIRGGGGNFGVATRFQFRLHQMETVTGGLLILPATPELVASFVAATQEAPDELSGLVNIMIAPPMPFIPAEHHGRPILLAMLVHAGTSDAGERVFAPLRALATPVADMIRPMRYAQLYEGDGEPPRPAAMAVRSIFLDAVDRAAGETIIDQLQRSRAQMRVVQLRVLGGEVARVPADATAFAHRARGMMAVVAAAYQDLEDAAEHEDWTARLAGELRQGEPGAYVGFLGDEGETRVREAYPGLTWERLRRVKARYDPTNLFRFNQNISPAEEPYG